MVSKLTSAFGFFVVGLKLTCITSVTEILIMQISMSLKTS